MCGIVGFTHAPGSPDPRRTVGAMLDAASHRGPDADGVAELGFATLGHRRLSIVDLADGQQPMTSASGTSTLVYNGEIYDCDGHRDALRARGVHPRTNSDTEVLLELWDATGEACLRELDGMFAFAVADARRRELVLVRDALGIKPLYYFVTATGELVFASELAALLAHPDVPRRVDRASLPALLVDRAVPDPWTLLEGVRQLPPGHRLTWRAGQVEVRRWWRFELAPEPRSEADALEQLETELDRAVRSQLCADVPVGVFLSGGIDSSTVAAYAAAAVDRPLASFSVGFADPAYDESALAREVAAHLGTEHHELRIEHGTFDPAVLDRIVDHVGQPLADLSCIPTLALADFAREHVTVCLSGDGGDELFCGYDHLQWAARVERVAASAPRSLRRAGAIALAGVAPLAPTSGLARTARRIRKGVELSLFSEDERMRRMMGLWTPEECDALLAERAPLAERPWLLEDVELSPSLRPEERAMAALAQTYLPAAILRKVDRMSMAASLEVRPPLLSKRIVELALRLPLELKLQGRTGKLLLRRAGEARLPGQVYTHRKQGFSIPMRGWMTDEFWDLLFDAYAPGSPAAELFEPGALQATLRELRGATSEGSRTSVQSAAARAWCLAMLARWMERMEVAA